MLMSTDRGEETGRPVRCEDKALNKHPRPAPSERRHKRRMLTLLVVQTRLTVSGSTELPPGPVSERVASFSSLA